MGRARGGGGHIGGIATADGGAAGFAPGTVVNDVGFHGDRSGRTVQLEAVL